jgi:hypothetical protein
LIERRVTWLQDQRLIWARPGTNARVRLAKTRRIGLAIGIAGGHVDEKTGRITDREVGIEDDGGFCWLAGSC